MLSYMLPVEDKPPPGPNKNHLQLELELQRQIHSPRNGAINGVHRVNGVKHDNVHSITMAPTTIQNFIELEQTHQTINGGSKKIMKSQTKMTSGPTISTESSASSLSSKTSDITSNTTPTSTEKLKPKLLQNGNTKTTSLKRVSFGSSKGSMVETLIYESPLQEEPELATPTVEANCPFPNDGEISGSDLKNPSTKVRVTFFESSRPLVVSSPEPGDDIVDILDAPNIMTTASDNVPQYNRQASTDSGWDNPFRPDGDLSREADQIVELIKEGKPITPVPGNGTLPTDTDQHDATSPLLSTRVTSNQASPQKGSNGATTPAGALDIQHKVVSSTNATEAEHVVLKKKPKCKCCVVQ